MNWLWWVPDWLAWRIMDAAALVDRDTWVQSQTEWRMKLWKGNPFGWDYFTAEPLTANGEVALVCWRNNWDGWKPDRYV